MEKQAFCHSVEVNIGCAILCIFITATRESESAHNGDVVALLF